VELYPKAATTPLSIIWLIFGRRTLSINWVKCCKLCECQDQGANNKIMHLALAHECTCVQKRHYVDKVIDFGGIGCEIWTAIGGHWLTNGEDGVLRIKRACTERNTYKVIQKLEEIIWNIFRYLQMLLHRLQAIFSSLVE